MFVRTKQQSNGKVSILIVENVREFGKVRQKTLRHVATVLPDEVDRFKELAEHIRADMKVAREQNLSKIREESRIVTGIHEIYGSLYDEIGFSGIFKSCRISGSVFKDMVMARLAKPCSKRSSAELLERDFGICIAIEKIYRMMDILTEKRINRIRDCCWYHSKGLLTEEIKVMFCDCTTLYFESFTKGELRRFGSGKDHKFNQGQILLALMVTREGLPVGYDVFPGNRYESDTFKHAIEKIKTRYRVKRVVIVADSSLLSMQNVELLEKENLQYILGARLKSLPKNWQDRILDNTDYDKKKKEDEILRIATYQYAKNRRLIVSHSTKRADKDRKNREKANEEKPERDALWDGLHGIITNVKEKEMNAEEALSQYHGLWQAEESFRLQKHDLKVRPVFHWSIKRIKAHIAICFAAFSLIRFLQYRLKRKTGEYFSAERIKDELFGIQESILVNTTDNNKYVLPSTPGQYAIKIYDAMSKKRHVVPFRITSKE